MAKLFVVDTVEFQPIVQEARRGGLMVRRIGDYYEVRGDESIIVERARCGLRDALWYGALTGGFQGRIDTFDADRLIITDE